MNVLSCLRRRFADAIDGLAADAIDAAGLVLPSQNPKFGDYQANCAMQLGRQLGQPPREIARQIVDRLDLAGLCEPPEIAGPGFINLRLRHDWLAGQLERALADESRLGVDPIARPRTFLLDYSAPNVAKPLHVGHIRSTIIGDSLTRLLRFLGHRTISDNHIGDWGTQFGMIIYGYRHFLDPDAFADNPLEELGRLYRWVNTLVRYHQVCETRLPELDRQIVSAGAEVEALDGAAAGADKAARKLLGKRRHQAARQLEELEAERARCRADVERVDTDPALARLAAGASDIQRAVLTETAKLHAGDAENMALWQKFMPPCLAGIEAIYKRLGVAFDHTLGESFYHNRLAGVVDDLHNRGLARVSEGAMCVFLDGHPSPMIVRKRDGAYLYATTDLATIQYRVEQFAPDAILYVVGQPQALHFDQLFTVARRWGYDSLEFEHIGFGTVLGEDHRPFRARSGGAVGLAGLLDEAVRRGHAIVSNNDDARPVPQLSDDERRRVAEAVGIGALKYADLSQNRESDYVFSYDKMLAMKGNTATYMQYSYARVRSIFAKGNVDPSTLRRQPGGIVLEHPAERALGIALVRFAESIERATADYRPNHLTTYLFELASRYADLFENCPVLRAEDNRTRQTRLKLCDLTARTLKLGLSLLGIDVLEKM